MLDLGTGIWWSLEHVTFEIEAIFPFPGWKQEAERQEGTLYLLVPRGPSLCLPGLVEEVHPPGCLPGRSFQAGTSSLHVMPLDIVSKSTVDKELECITCSTGTRALLSSQCCSVLGWSTLPDFSPKDCFLSQGLSPLWQWVIIANLYSIRKQRRSML